MTQQTWGIYVLTAMVIVLGAIILFTRTIVDGRTRRELGGSGASPEVVRMLYRRRDPDYWGSLRWGILMLSIAVALVLLQVLPFGGEDPIVYGIVLAFGGGGMLLYHRLLRRGGGE